MPMELPGVVAEHVRLRLGNSLRYPLAIHFYRDGKLIQIARIKWTGAPGALWKIAIASVRFGRPLVRF